MDGSDLNVFRYEGSACSDLDDIKTFIQGVLNKLKNILEDEDLMFDLRLILNELVINSVIHGNRCNKRKCKCIFRSEK